MKVRVSYTVHVDDDFRRAINRFHAEPGLATRKDIKEWFRMYGESMENDLDYGEEEDA